MKNFIYRLLMRWANRFADEPLQGKFTRNATAHPYAVDEQQKKTLRKRNIAK